MGSLIAPLCRVQIRERILTGQLEVVVHVLQLLEMIFLQNNEPPELMIVTSGTVQTINYIFLVLKYTFYYQIYF